MSLRWALTLSLVGFACGRPQVEPPPPPALTNARAAGDPFPGWWRIGWEVRQDRVIDFLRRAHIPFVRARTSHGTPYLDLGQRDGWAVKVTFERRSKNPFIEGVVFTSRTYRNARALREHARQLERLLVLPPPFHRVTGDETRRRQTLLWELEFSSELEVVLETAETGATMTKTFRPSEDSLRLRCADAGGKMIPPARALAQGEHPALEPFPGWSRLGWQARYHHVLSFLRASRIPAEEVKLVKDASRYLTVHGWRGWDVTVYFATEWDETRSDGPPLSEVLFSSPEHPRLEPRLETLREHIAELTEQLGPEPPLKQVWRRANVTTETYLWRGAFSELEVTLDTGKISHMWKRYRPKKPLSGDCRRVVPPTHERVQSR